MLGVQFIGLAMNMPKCKRHSRTSTTSEVIGYATSVPSTMTCYICENSAELTAVKAESSTISTPPTDFFSSTCLLRIFILTRTCDTSVLKAWRKQIRMEKQNHFKPTNPDLSAEKHCRNSLANMQSSQAYNATEEPDFLAWATVKFDRKRFKGFGHTGAHWHWCQLGST